MSDSQRFKITFTGAGIAAILVAIPGITAHFKEETVARKVAVSAEKNNDTLFNNQKKLRDRMLVAETRVETLLAILQRTAFNASEYQPSLPTASVVSTVPVISTVKPKKCRKHYVLRDGKCKPVVKVLADTVEKLATAKAQSQQAYGLVRQAVKERIMLKSKQKKLSRPKSVLESTKAE